MNSVVTALAEATTTPSSSPAASVASELGKDVETIGGIANLLNTYGAAIVILAVFIFLFLGAFAYIITSNRNFHARIIKENEEAKEFTNDLIKELVNSLKNDHPQELKSIVKETIEEEAKKEEKTHQSVVNVYVNANLAFKDASRIAMSKLKCQRVAVYLFHNGNQTPFGFPFAKVSCVHEWTMKGSHTPRGMSHVNVPLHAFMQILQGLNDDGEVAIGDVTNYSIVHNDEQIFNFLYGSQANSIFALAIRNRDNQLVAFTIAEFHDSQDFTDEDIYNRTKNALKDMNDNIYSIVVSDEFKGNYANDIKNAME